MNHRYFSALVALTIAAAPLGATCTFGFLSPSPYTTNANPGDVTTGDFNNDGYVDIVAVNRTLSQLSLLPGTAGGGFGAHTTIVTDYSQGDVHAGHFNTDNNLDLVLALPWSANFTVSPHLKILLGNGNGTFTPVPYTSQQLVWQNPSRVVLGDFNHDGKTDAATAKSGGFSSMQNVGGKLAQKAEYSISGIPNGIARGDFDGDGQDDIAVSEQISKKIHLYFGIGDGTFTVGGTIDLPHATREPADVQAGDFNGDGKHDLAISVIDTATGSAPLKIALSNGVARTFATPVDYGSMHAYEALVADVNGDGARDVLAANLGSGGLTIFRGNGDGTFASPDSFLTASTALGLAVDDFDRDGGLDVVVTGFSQNRVDVLLNTCGRVTVNLTSSANPAAQGTPITITGTVVSPPALAATGTLTLKRNTTTLNSGNLTAGNSVVATMTDLTPATYPIFAEYSGDSRFLAVTKNLQQVVTVPPFGPPPGLNAISFGGPVQLAWFATANTDHYEVWRNNGAGWTFIANAPNAFFTDSTAAASSAMLYKVRAIAPGGAASDYSSADLALTYVFTDSTLQAGVTPAKLAHLTELRSAANAVRAVASLAPMSWAEPTPQLIRASHFTELRTAVQQARTALGLATPTYTDPTLTAGSTIIKALHVEQLRSAMR